MDPNKQARFRNCRRVIFIFYYSNMVEVSNKYLFAYRVFTIIAVMACDIVVKKHVFKFRPSADIMHDHETSAVIGRPVNHNAGMGFAPHAPCNNISRLIILSFFCDRKYCFGYWSFNLVSRTRRWSMFVSGAFNPHFLGKASKSAFISSFISF